MKTNAIPNPIDADLHVVLQSGGLWCFSRRVAVLFASQLVVLAAYGLIASWFVPSIDWTAMWLAFVVMQVACAGGQFFSLYPRGNQSAEIRLYLSTGFRSGMPLLAMIAIDLFIYPDLLPGGLGILLLLYGFGFVQSVLLTVRGLDSIPA